MSSDAWITIAIVVFCFGLLVRGRAPPDLVMTGGLTLLLLKGIITPQQALSGFANEGVITVAVLYIVVTGIRETGGIAWIVQSVLGRPKSISNAQFRIMAPVAVLSAFLNNTPVVAMFIPAIDEWARRYRISVSKLMIPLSYAAIIGGMCTLIGTSTNLIINGMLLNEPNLPRLGLFDIAWVGFPATIMVLLYVVLTSKWLLPERRPVIKQFDNPREYTIEMLVETNSPLIGKSIEDAGLRQLPGMFLIEIERNNRIIPAVSPEELLQSKDRLLFAGIVESVIDLQKIRGLIPATNQIFKVYAPREERLLIEAVISNTCPFIGKKIRESNFRNLYNAAIIGVARNGERLKEKIGNIVPRAGDTLLIAAHPSFAAQQRNSRDFLLVSPLLDSEPIHHKRAAMAVVILVCMVLLVATGLLSMLKAAMLAAGLMILTRCTRGRIARRAVNLQVIIVIAASLGIGTALHATGAASATAQALMSLSGDNPWWSLSLVFVITSLFTAVATNNVAAVLMFPIAQAVAQDLNVNFMPYAITIMMAASASFTTPIGYQTNLMVMGSGGYRFVDYLRIGLPLTLLVGILTVSLSPRIWPF